MLTSRPFDSRCLLALLLPLAAACTEPTATCRDNPNSHCVGAGDLERFRGLWRAQNLTKYQYDYRLTGFFIDYADRPIRITVLNGTVVSALDLETNQLIPGPLSQWPTIDSLFDQVARAAQAGDLIRVRYDTQFGFPTEIDLAGPPDASGSLFATHLQLLPEP